MYTKSPLPRRLARRAAGLALVAVSGCGDLLGPDGQQTRQTLSLNALDVENNATFVETGQNDRFATADLIALADEEQIISGHIEDATSVDVYDLGPIAIGDRIVVDLVTSESLKGAIAIFDDTGTAILVNDHRNVYLGRSDPFVDIISMHNTDACYVAVAPTPGFPSAGPYALVATKQRGVPLPEQRPDTILLDFSGAVGIAFGGRPPVDIPPFDAARLAPRFAGETDELTARIVEDTRDHFEGLNVVILSTSDGDIYDGHMSRLYFGAFDEALLGVAEGVDEFNGTDDQEAIVFTDTFSAFTPLDPTIEEIAQALANVASHEIGHLLGLQHTADPAGIMDVTASLHDLLTAQRFTRSPLFSVVFPIGFQDAAQTLLETVGGDPDVVLQKSSAPAARRRHTPAGPPVRQQVRLSTCSLMPESR